MGLYPLAVSFVAMSLAQILKPILFYLVYGEWNFKLLTDSGGLPSSHSSTVVSLALSVGLIDNFSSMLFSVTVAFAMITMYDAANVRYYAGKNIELTRKLVDDLRSTDFYLKRLTDPIYDERIKQILGHNWFEVLSGALLGVVVALVAYYGILT